LRSNRNAKKKRHLGRAGVLAEVQAKRFRGMLAISGRKPAKIAHERALEEKAPAEQK
jgi:hypothetical protein